MVKIYFLFWLLFLNCLFLHAQAPQGINYQGVAREVSGTPIASRQIAVRISVVRDNANGTVEYSEHHSVKTNAFGLFALVIGSGTVTKGEFAFISWADGNKWVRVEIDPQNGTNYQIAGNQQLMSVPFALYSQYSGSGYAAGPGITIQNNTISNSGDNSSTNEIQHLSLNANQLSLSQDTAPVNLAPYMQNLSFDPASNNLSINGGNTVNITQSLGTILDNGNDAGGRVIANAGAPANASDVTTKGYVDTAIAARYAFKVSYSFNNQGSPVANQQVPFAAESFDDFDVVASNQFTVPPGGAGVYVFYVDGTSNNSAVALKVRLNYNNSNLYPVKRQASFPNLLVINDFQTLTLKLSVGDVVDLVVDSNGSADYTTGVFFGNRL